MDLKGNNRTRKKNRAMTAVPPLYTYVVLDLETTGLDTRTHRVIQIAAKVLSSNRDSRIARHDSERFVSTPMVYCAFINPQTPNYARSINLIDDALLAQCQPFANVIPTFWSWVEQVYDGHGRHPIVFIGHNYDVFDEAMLVAEHARARMSPPSHIPMYKMDTMKLARYIFPTTVKNVPYGLPMNHYPDSYRQADLFRFFFHHDPPQQHDALGDIYALEDILNTSLFVPVVRSACPEASKL